MEHRLSGSNPEVAAKIRELRKEMEREFGWIAVAAGKLLGPGALVDQPARGAAAGRGAVLRACHRSSTGATGAKSRSAPRAMPAVYKPRRLAPELISLETGESSSGD